MYDPIGDWKITIKITAIFLVLVVIMCVVSYRPYEPKEEGSTNDKTSYVECDRCDKRVDYDSVEGYFIATYHKCKKCYIDYAGSINARNDWKKQEDRFNKDHKNKTDTSTPTTK